MYRQPYNSHFSKTQLYSLLLAIIPPMKKLINFKVQTPYKPAGDQPTAIKELSESILKGNRYQTLEGVTGSGKTYTMPNVGYN